MDLLLRMVVTYSVRYLFQMLHPIISYHFLKSNPHLFGSSAYFKVYRKIVALIGSDAYMEAVLNQAFTVHTLNM